MGAKKTDLVPHSGSRTLGQLKKLYITIVISILAFLALQQVLLHWSINESKAFARHINLAGRQRMLSQNIAKLCLLFEKNSAYREELLATTDTWNNDYHDLLHGNQQKQIDSPTNPLLLNELRIIGERHLKMSQHIEQLVNGEGRAREAAMTAILKDEKLFLGDMERIVRGYQLDAENSVTRITRLEYIMTTIAVIIILLEVFFVFRPTRRIIVGQEMQLEEKIRNITDSIRYAKKVQDSILPSHKRITAHLPQSFVLYLPKDIVAGDFYWIEALQLDLSHLDWEKDAASDDEKNGQHSPMVLFAVADCTGHGVPGAMVSIVCHNAIDKVVKEFGLVKPALILDKVNELVRNTFNRGEQGVTDGMDISICCLNRATNRLEWAGANNPLWIVRKEGTETSLLEFKPDKQPIGDYVTTRPFTHHTIDLMPGDCIYLFSDGFSDQFGGKNGKKLTRVQMKKMLIELNGADDMNVQRKQLRDRFLGWKKDMEQIDDVCVMGIRV